MSLDRPFWTTREGEEIAIEDMGTSHLLNTIGMQKIKIDEFNKIPLPTSKSLQTNINTYVEMEQATFYFIVLIDAMEREVESRNTTTVRDI